MAPVVSVCIPCFNASQFVIEAVASVLNQSWRDLEVIVVDDGSSDSSPRLLAAVGDSRLHVIKQQNRGQCAAANRAFAESRGQFIKFFDADDVLSPDHIALQMSRLGRRHDAISLGQWGRFCGAALGEAEFNHLPHFRDIRPVDWLVMDWVGAQPMMQCGLWLIPRQILDRSGLWDERLSLINDFEFFARVLTNASEILYAPGAKLFYRSGIAGSLSGQKSRKAVESAFLSLMLGTSHLLAVEDTPRTRRACANVLQDFDYTYFPRHSDLRRKACARVAELGGADVPPTGPPGFQRLRPLMGWKAARLTQHAAEALKLNRASRAT